MEDLTSNHFEFTNGDKKYIRQLIKTHFDVELSSDEDSDQSSEEKTRDNAEGVKTEAELQLELIKREAMKEVFFNFFDMEKSCGTEVLAPAVQECVKIKEERHESETEEDYDRLKWKVKSEPLDEECDPSYVIDSQINANNSPVRLETHSCSFTMFSNSSHVKNNKNTENQKSKSPLGTELLIDVLDENIGLTNEFNKRLTNESQKENFKPGINFDNNWKNISTERLLDNCDRTDTKGTTADEHESGVSVPKSVPLDSGSGITAKPASIVSLSDEKMKPDISFKKTSEDVSKERDLNRKESTTDEYDTPERALTTLTESKSLGSGSSVREPVTKNSSNKKLKPDFRFKKTQEDVPKERYLNRKELTTDEYDTPERELTTLTESKSLGSGNSVREPVTKSSSNKKLKPDFRLKKTQEDVPKERDLNHKESTTDEYDTPERELTTLTESKSLGSDSRVREPVTRNLSNKKLKPDFRFKKTQRDVSKEKDSSAKESTTDDDDTTERDLTVLTESKSKNSDSGVTEPVFITNMSDKRLNPDAASFESTWKDVFKKRELQNYDLKNMEKATTKHKPFYSFDAESEDFRTKQTDLRKPTEQIDDDSRYASKKKYVCQCTTDMCYKPMKDPKGKFYIDREIETMYQDGLKEKNWNPTQCVYELCSQCGWVRPHYVLIDRKELGYLFQVVVNNQLFCSERRGKNKKIAMHYASTTFLHFIGFEFNFDQSEPFNLLASTYPRVAEHHRARYATPVRHHRVDVDDYRRTDVCRGPADPRMLLMEVNRSREYLKARNILHRPLPCETDYSYGSKRYKLEQKAPCCSCSGRRS